MVGATGFEPTTPWSQARCSTKLSYAPILTSSRAIILRHFIVVLMRNTSKLYMKLLLSKNGATGGIRTPDPRLRRPLLYPTELQTRKNGRSDRIRTYDPLVPSQVLYQTELRPDNARNIMPHLSNSVKHFFAFFQSPSLALSCTTLLIITVSSQKCKHLFNNFF